MKLEKNKIGVFFSIFLGCNLYEDLSIIIIIPRISISL